MLDPDVILVSDGGGVVSAARKPVLGADRVARFLLGVMAKGGPNWRIDQVDVNGSPGFALYRDGDLVTVVSVTVAHDRVTRLDLVRAPAKLPGASSASGCIENGADIDGGALGGLAFRNE